MIKMLMKSALRACLAAGWPAQQQMRAASADAAGMEELEFLKEEEEAVNDIIV